MMSIEKTVSALGEFQLIETLFSRLVMADDKRIIKGVGDDSAVLNIPRTQHLLTTTDTLIEGVHFNSDTDPFILGRKALRVNLSDIAAMGGVPHWYVLSLAIPSTTSLKWAEEFARGLDEAGKRFNVSLVGGDMVASTGPIIITITLNGLVGEGRAIMRSSAQVGDRIYVTGTIGDSALGLAHRLGRVKISDAHHIEFLKHRHQIPEPRLSVGKMLQDTAIARSIIDVSDGLVADLEHICSASGVGARLHADKVPLSDAARAVLDGDDTNRMMQMVLTGGEDYELIFTASADIADAISDITDQTGVALTEIGEIVKGESVVTVCRDGEPWVLERGGWKHF
ncbi:MAG: thiamine-phosphate kinase [Magnetococcales bacterium]|nr:thiamine-phosphate kinase [Magnetococcales bacterium]